MFPQEVTTSNKHRLYQSSEHIVSALPATKKNLLFDTSSYNLCY